MRIVLFIVCGAIFFFASLCQATPAKTGFGLDDLIVKLPMVVPFVVSKVKSNDCKKRLEDFRTDLKDLNKNDNLKVIQKAFCKLEKACTEEIVKVFMGYIKAGGMVEKLAQQQLGADFDLKNLDSYIWTYYETFCSIPEKTQEL